ncbi:MAG: hypothetical protein JWM82_816 [Myxococcales bacterium]|nr:hypothetical protein [Myxococcales bacterium]
MWWLSRKRFARHFDHDRVKRAIEEAERKTSGEIVVSVSPYFLGSVQRAAERAFVRLGVVRTQHRNGVLFFVVPGKRQFVVLGDLAIHEKLGQDFWEAVTKTAALRFRTGDINGGLVDGIQEVASRLAELFPREDANDRNELSDEPDV